MAPPASVSRARPRSALRGAEAAERAKQGQLAAPGHSLSFAGLAARDLCHIEFPHIFQLPHLAGQHLDGKRHDVLWEGEGTVVKEPLPQLHYPPNGFAFLPQALCECCSLPGHA